MRLTVELFDLGSLKGHENGGGRRGSKGTVRCELFAIFSSVWLAETLVASTNKGNALLYNL